MVCSGVSLKHIILWVLIVHSITASIRLTSEEDDGKHELGPKSASTRSSASTLKTIRNCSNDQDDDDVGESTNSACTSSRRKETVKGNLLELVGNNTIIGSDDTPSTNNLLGAGDESNQEDTFIRVLYKGNWYDFFEGALQKHTFQCSLPKSMFNNGFHWLYLCNDGKYIPIKDIPEDDLENFSDSHHYYQKVRISFPSSKITHVVCSGMIKDKPGFQSNSVPVVVKKSTIPQILNYGILPQPIIYRDGLNLTCWALATPVHWEWYKDGERISWLNISEVVGPGEESRSTIFLNPSPYDWETNYTCVASNFLGTASSSFKVLLDTNLGPGAIVGWSLACIIILVLVVLGLLGVFLPKVVKGGHRLSWENIARIFRGLICHVHACTEQLDMPTPITPPADDGGPSSVNEDMSQEYPEEPSPTPTSTPTPPTYHKLRPLPSLPTNDGNLPSSSHKSGGNSSTSHAQENLAFSAKEIIDECSSSLHENSKEIALESVEFVGPPKLGNFGQVWIGRVLTSSGVRIYRAIKAVKDDALNPKFRTKWQIKEAVQSFIDEIRIMEVVGHHQNVVGYIGTVGNSVSRLSPYLVMEYCCEENLQDYLRRCREQGTFNDDVGGAHENGNNGVLKTSILLKWSEDIASGLEYLATKRIVHRDIASRNVGLGCPGLQPGDDYLNLDPGSLTAKLLDLGLARVLEGSEYYRIVTHPEPERNKHRKLPLRWMAIEALEADKYKFSTQSDVWSMAVTLWEMFSLGETPFKELFPENDAKLQTNLIQHFKDGNTLLQPDYAPDEMWDLMLNCWNLNARERPSPTRVKDILHELNGRIQIELQLQRMEREEQVAVQPRSSTYVRVQPAPSANLSMPHYCSLEMDDV